MHVNGVEMTLEQSVSLQDFLMAQGYDIRTIAVERNEEIVPKADYADIMLQDTDILEVVHFMGGGQETIGGHSNADKTISR
ncbi:MAG: sulfur carrier protein ThiS [Oscillospiraceae bacterium]|nr:sulfur carrier protein ThiS [Oscillospiraceae bacterium]